ncbi:MAG TPA: hypothetical protein HA326_04600 [Thermoplasmata archaeon]|nr:hypothetical protein [Thermoplasmata archaeon]
MTRLTPETVRVRAAALILLVALTFSLVILGLVFFSSSGWFWVAAVFIDVPIWLLLAILERAERSDA